jgi:ATP-binding cassette subfamily B protein
MSPHSDSTEYDSLQAVTANRLLGLWRIMAGFRWTYIAATLSLGLSAVARVATFMLVRYFVDEVLGQDSKLGMVPGVALAFVALALVQGAFTFWSGSLAAKAAEGIIRRVRNDLFDHIQRLSFSYHDRTSTGDLIERCTSDVDAMRRFFADQAIGVGRILSLFFVSLAGLLRLNVRLALVSVVVVPILVAMSLYFFRLVSKAYEAVQEQEAVVSTTLQENLTAMRVVKAFARQDFEMLKFERDNWEKLERGTRFVMLHSLYWPISDLLCGVQMLVGVSAGALMTMDGAITVGTYLAYTGLLIWVIWPIRNLGRFIVDMSSGLVSYQRVAQVLAEPREPLWEGTCGTDADVRGEVVFHEVSFVYPSGYRALDRVSFRCDPGQAVALLGSTGSGKTTLVNLLPRFYEYTEGSVTLDGVELKDYPRAFLRRQIGIVEQEPFLFSRTILENITYGVERAVSEQEIEAAARAAAIHDDIVEFAKGYESVIGERGVMLSGGQKQRVAIARTLLKDPRILILDDSTSSVDVETEHLIRQALQGLMEGRTSFIIAHRVQSVMDADLILVFDEGRVVQMGRHQELLEQEGMYRRVYEMQTQIDVQIAKEMAGVGLS